MILPKVAFMAKLRLQTTRVKSSNYLTFIGFGHIIKFHFSNEKYEETCQSGPMGQFAKL